MRPLWRDVRWIVIGVAAIAALVLGYLGFDEYLEVRGERHSFGDILYRSLQLFGLEGGNVDPPIPWELEAARLLAPVVAVYAAVSAIAALLREQLQLLRLRFMRNHVVVCGLGERGLLLAKEFNARGDRVVAIEKDDEARGIGECREEGVIVLIGDVTDRTILRKARIERAKHVIAVARDDGINAEVAVDARSVIERRRGVLTRFRSWVRRCVLRRSPAVLTAFVHVIDPNLCRLLREKVSASPEAGSYRLEFFSVYDIAARILVHEYLTPARDDGGAEANKRMVLVGLGQMGEALVLHAATAWRAIHSGSSPRLEVGIVDEAAGRKCESLLLRYPRLRSMCDLTEHEMNIKDPAFSRARFLVDETGARVASVAFICFDDDPLGLRAAQALLPKTRQLRVPLVVRMRQRTGLATLVGPTTSEREDGLHVFPLLDRTCAPDLLLEGSASSLTGSWTT